MNGWISFEWDGTGRQWPGSLGDGRGTGGQERKGREVGVLRGWEAGEKCETLFFYFNKVSEYSQKQEPKMFLTCIQHPRSHF